MPVFWNTINQRRVSIIVAIFVMSSVSDNPSVLKNLRTSSFYRVLIDSLCHQIIGILTYLSYSYLVSFKSENYLMKIDRFKLNIPSYVINILLSQFFSCVLDLDHFVAAKSFKLYDATHLSSRPFGHAISFILLVYFLLYGIERLISRSHITQWTLTETLRDIEERHPVDFSSCEIESISTSKGKIATSTIYLLSSLTHVIRDSSRRGLWLICSWKSPSVPYGIHILLLCLLPYAIYSIHRALGYTFMRHTNN